MDLRKFESLLLVMDELREKCPWDKKQTFDSIKSNTIEECYELIDAITSRDFDNVKEELGDMLLQVVFYSKMGDEMGLFNASDVIETINQKLIRRHPHVFSTSEVNGVDDVMKNWESIKQTERETKPESKKRVLGGVPSALPALIKAYRVQQKAASVGFDWADAVGAWEKVAEETAEFKAEVEAADKEKMKGEFGDLLFALINCGRKYGIEPEEALELSNRKFISRFNHIEDGCSGDFKSLTLDQMEELWDEAKKLEKR